MATGILGQATPAAATNTVVYTVPSATVAVATISIVNRGAYPAIVNVAVASSGTPAANEFIEFQTVIDVNGVFERSGIVANANEAFVVFSTTPDTSVTIYGYEEA